MPSEALALVDCSLIFLPLITTKSIDNMLLSRLIRNLSPHVCKHLLLLTSADLKMALNSLSSKSSLTENTTLNKFVPVTHVIFDMDGLLLDTECVYKAIITEITESYGKKYTEDIQLRVLGTTEQMTAKLVVEECGLPIRVDEFLEKFRAMANQKLGNCKLMQGAQKLVTHLSKNRVPIAVATSSGAKSVEVKTQHHKDLFKLFNHIVMGSTDPEVKCGKPAPDIFMVCAQRFSDKPDYGKCLVFEDAPNGVTGAVAAGMQTVMVPDSCLPKERTCHATLVLKSLCDFQPEVFGLPPFK